MMALLFADSLSVGDHISSANPNSGLAGQAVLTLLFAEGQRPDSQALKDLSQTRDSGGSAFAVTHCPAPGSGWVELLANGLAFDCRGLAPAQPAPRPSAGPLFSLNRVPDQGEAIELVPGPHLADGAPMLPVVRAMVGIGARLATLPGVLAVNWRPARSWMGPDYYTRVTGDWLAGGVFPALGLAALERLPDGSFSTVGLGFLIGQEIVLDLGGRALPAAVARIAVRLANDLVTGGPAQTAMDLTGPANEALRAEPERGGAVLRVSPR